MFMLNYCYWVTLDLRFFDDRYIGVQLYCVCWIEIISWFHVMLLLSQKDSRIPVEFWASFENLWDEWPWFWRSQEQGIIQSKGKSL